jgi:hypothetical protein
VFFRDGRKFFAKEIKVEKDEMWKREILDLVLQAVQTGKTPETTIPTDEEFKTQTKKVAKPPKAEAVEKKIRRSRFLVS